MLTTTTPLCPYIVSANNICVAIHPQLLGSSESPTKGATTIQCVYGAVLSAPDALNNGVKFKLYVDAKPDAIDVVAFAPNLAQVINMYTYPSLLYVQGRFSKKPAAANGKGG